MPFTILAAIGVMLLLALALTAALAVANVRFAVQVDPRQAQLAALLPQANCGGCGFASCRAYAKAIHEGQAELDRCTVGGPPVAEQLAEVMGVTLVVNYPFRPVLHCVATNSQRLKQGHYTGELRCAAAQVVGGVLGCSYGCLGMGDCVLSCEYDAIEMMDGLPRINYQNCVGCGACVRACPRNLLEQVPFKAEQMLVVGCANHDPGKSVREVCRVGCIGCGLCVRKFPELFEIDNHLATIRYEHYTGEEDFSLIREKCPTQSLVMFGSPPHAAEDAAASTVAVAGRPQPAERPTKEDFHWRG